jgi:hypothetical protein
VAYRWLVVSAITGVGLVLVAPVTAQRQDRTDRPQFGQHHSRVLSERTLVNEPDSDETFQNISLQQLENGEQWVKQTATGPSFQGRHPESHSHIDHLFVAVNTRTGRYRAFRYRGDLNENPRIKAYVRHVLSDRNPAPVAAVEKPRPALRERVVDLLHAFGRGVGLPRPPVAVAGNAVQPRMALSTTNQAPRSTKPGLNKVGAPSAPAGRAASAIGQDYYGFDCTGWANTWVTTIDFASYVGVPVLSADLAQS